ncbi:MAG: type II toxin-antitoxin system HicB family antitoxin [Candidatus Peregrinibacteria bacterium]|nr:type II toxin-antitoxin system HicB family antitoxin [Candidatus Peregrinibacteria bacterium]
MFTQYVRYIMEHMARYEVIKDRKPHYGSIKGFKGVWAQGRTLAECEQELQEVLEEWLLLKIRKGGFVPTVRKYNLNALLAA